MSNGGGDRYVGELLTALHAAQHQSAAAHIAPADELGREE